MAPSNSLALTVNTGQVSSSKMRKASLLRMMLPMPSFHWHDKSSTNRLEIESYIANKFHLEYDANVCTFAPLLLSMHCQQDLSAAVGIRPALSTPLFIEQYLDTNIEKCIQSPDIKPVKRHEIVEISNLVTTRRGASQLLFIVLGSVMYEAGYRWLVFSATDKVERITRKFPFPVQILASSNPDSLGDRATEWGRYYETNPRVIVGDIKVAYQKAQSNHLLKMALMFYRPVLRKLVRNMPKAV